MHWIPMILALFLPATALPRAETDDNLQKRDCLQSDQMLQLLTENKNRNSICAEFMDARNPTVSMFSETETAATILVTVPAETSTHTLRQTELHTNTQFESATITGTALPPPPTIVMNTVNYYEPSTVTVTQTSRGTTTITSIVTSIFTSYTSITASLPPGVGARSAPFDEVSLPSTPTDMDLPLLFPRQIDANATITSACSCLRLPTPTTTFTVTTKMTPPAVTVSLTQGTFMLSHVAK